MQARTLGSNEQRRGIRDIGHVLVGFGLQQHLHNFKMTKLGCNEGGSGVVVCLLVRLCTRHQQEGRGVLVAVLACNIQWRCIGLRRQVDFSFVLHQEFDSFVVAVLTCNKEGRSTTSILGSFRKQQIKPKPKFASSQLMIVIRLWVSNGLVFWTLIVPAFNLPASA